MTDTVKLMLLLALGAGLLFGVQTVLDWREAAIQGEQRGRTLAAASGITKDGQQIEAQRLIIDVGLLEARAEFQRQLEEGSAREPETAARATRAVPDSRLRAFRERRLARERLGCAGTQCEERPTPANAAER